MDHQRMVDELNDLAAKMCAMSSEIQQIDTRAKSQERSASDRTGAVIATLGADDLPIRFRVSHNWEVLLSGSPIDLAVLESASAAYLKGWEAASTQIQTDKSHGRRCDDPISVPQPPSFQGVPRTPWAILEDSLASLDALADDAAPICSSPLTLRGVGEARRGAVRIELAPYGLAACSIDAKWAQGTSPATLTNEINSALNSAKENLKNVRANTQCDSLSDVLLDRALEALALLESFVPATNPANGGRE